MPVAEELFYILSKYSPCGNSAYWWAIDGHGYTCNLDRAWKVPRDKAEDVCRGGRGDKGRPTKWGNDWTTTKYWDAGYSGSHKVAIQHCVEAYRAWLEGREHWAHGKLRPVPDLSLLRGKDLACWCKVGQPCHADVLLELANRPEILCL